MFNRLVTLLPCLFLLNACSTSLQVIGDTFAPLRGRSDKLTDTAKLDTRYRYLRVTVHGRSTLMILGYVDPAPHTPVEVWYSAGGAEVLRLQDGRVVGTTAMPTDWSNVRLSALPSWSSISAPLTLTRRRDVMPGYDYGVVDTLSVIPIAPPSGTHLVGVPVDRLSWFKETSSGREPLPPGRYGVSIRNGQGIVVYGEQCLSRSFCISWQRWPANS
ncbi:YjbF family lipoprotein [Trinickia acidisoli]|uniref:YjbF family lipoprotein n=1 Tax=Trinickia acidisoli TaxID=2767482 RepID=UPI001A8DFAB1|nr:YjbF family lipoprotein [Trinickia acidisoli]